MYACPSSSVQCVSSSSIVQCHGSELKTAERRVSRHPKPRLCGELSIINLSRVLNCSDGAGRTGAFCVIADSINRLKYENSIDIFRAAKDLRDFRPGMIQTLVS